MSILNKLDSTLGNWSIDWICTDLPKWLEWTAVPVLKLILSAQILVQKFK